MTSPRREHTSQQQATTTTSNTTSNYSNRRSSPSSPRQSTPPPLSSHQQSPPSPSTTTTTTNNTQTATANGTYNNSNSSPRSSPSHSSSSPSGSSSSPTHSPNSTSTSQNSKARRVKVYRLLQSQWADLGTGMCTSDFLETGPGSTHPPSEDGAWITVRSEPNGELDEQTVILRTRVVPYPPGYVSDEDEDEDEDDEDDLVDNDDLDQERRRGDGGEGEGEGVTTRRQQQKKERAAERRAAKVEDPGGYQRQQDTLIVWTERETETDMALSFATAAGCAEIWNFIRKARRVVSEQPLTSPSPSPSLSSPQTFPMYNLTTKLPEPTLGNIELIETTIRSLGRTVVGREKMAATIIRGEYVRKLIRIQREAEEMESLRDLHALCRVMQTILLLNDNGIFELVLRDEVILGVVSILEYDPEFPTMKASYRSHLADPSHFTLVVPIQSTSLLAKIHQTHRLHYLKDVVLARVLEDSTFSMLNSAIYFNEVDIVNEVATDPVLLRDVFAIFDEEDGGVSGKGTAGGAMVNTPPVDREGRKPVQAVSGAGIGPQLPKELARSLGLIKDDDDAGLPRSLGSTSVTINTSSSSVMDIDSPNNNNASTPPPAPPDRKHNAILFLQQLCAMAKNIQVQMRSAFFRSLAERGLLRVIELALSRTVTREDGVMRGATVEILMTLVDHDPNNVRGYSLKQHAGGGKRALAMFLIELFHGEEDLGLKAQMAEALRVLVDAGGEGGPLEAPPRMRQEDPEAEKFLQYFYDECIKTLMAPMFEVPKRNSPSDPPIELPIPTLALCGHLCDLMCFFVSHHTFRSKYYVLASEVALAISRLFGTRHKHLQLAALRFFRACVGKSDDFYNRFLMKNDLFGPILELVAREKEKDNLITSAGLEFFEFIRTSNAKAVINHLMDRYGERVRQLALWLRTFEMIIAKWEQNNEPPPSAEVPAAAAVGAPPPREAGSWSRMDMEEESYFNASDDEDDSTGVTTSPSMSTRSGSRKREADAADGDRKRAKIDGPPSPSGGPGVSTLPRSKTWPEAAGDAKGKGRGLVDYGEDDEEDIATAGGFVRAQGAVVSSSAGKTEEEEEEIGPRLDEAAVPPPTPPKRKEVDDEDELSLLSAKRKPSPKPGGAKSGGVAANSGSAGKIKMSLGVKSGSLANLSGAGTSTPPKEGK
ncbi:DUF625-domain-containing protein [Meredithblackwellia eburnea MCA 4105]